MKLRVNEVVQAKLTEIQRDGSLVVSFAGSLLRVQNHTKRNFEVGQMIPLLVLAVKPLKFRLAVGNERRDRINLSV